MDEVKEVCVDGKMAILLIIVESQSCRRILPLSNGQCSRLDYHYSLITDIAYQDQVVKIMLFCVHL